MCVPERMPPTSPSSALLPSAEAHLLLLSAQLPVFFWTVNTDLIITDHWGRGLQRHAANRTAAVGRNIAQYFRCRTEAAPPVKEHRDALQGISSRFEFQHRARIFDMSVEPFRGPQNEIIGCLGLALDISEQKKAEEHMLHQATHDGLTGLSNYRAFFDAFEREVLRCERSGGAFSLLLIDLDGLKAVNDRLGHMVGNRALKRLARVLKETCRATDLAARFGGDEFALLLIDAPKTLAEQVAGRVDKILREDMQFPPLSASMGLAVYPEDATSAQELFEIADKRLYRNKHASRLQVVPGSAPEYALGRLR